MIKEILPLGTVLKIKKGRKPVMIISRGALYNHSGVIGYFDYSACLYPDGQNTSNVLFFNQEEIEEVLFEGFSDELEEQYLEIYKKEIAKSKYPKLHLSEDNEKKERF